MDLLKATQELCRSLADLEFGPPVTHTYNPLIYAGKNYTTYLETFGSGPKQAIFLGMNPGPWGMAQTGVPFGDPQMVKSWLGITGPVNRPTNEHPKRPVLGLSCERREVSGSRLWGAARDCYRTPDRFFRKFFVANYCPFCFLEDSGRNRTPDKLPLNERAPLYKACDRYLRCLIAELSPRIVVGIGAFAAKRASIALEGMSVEIGQVLHPSPASPAANQGWAAKVAAQLAELGLCEKATGPERT